MRGGLCRVLTNSNRIKECLQFLTVLNVLQFVLILCGASHFHVSVSEL